MANKLIKITVALEVQEDGACLYGVMFKKTGAKGKEKYVAEVEQDTVQSLIDAEKVSIVK